MLFSQPSVRLAALQSWRREGITVAAYIFVSTCKPKTVLSLLIYGCKSGNQVFLVVMLKINVI
jgi:hypothetical protein